MERFIAKFAVAVLGLFALRKPVVAAVAGPPWPAAASSPSPPTTACSGAGPPIGLNEVKVGVPLPWSVTRSCSDRGRTRRACRAWRSSAGTSPTRRRWPWASAHEVAEAEGFEAACLARLEEFADKDPPRVATTKAWLREAALARDAGPRGRAAWASSSTPGSPPGARAKIRETVAALAPEGLSRGQIGLAGGGARARSATRAAKTTADERRARGWRRPRGASPRPSSRRASSPRARGTRTRSRTRRPRGRGPARAEARRRRRRACTAARRPGRKRLTKMPADPSGRRPAASAARTSGGMTLRPQPSRRSRAVAAREEVGARPPRRRSPSQHRTPSGTTETSPAPGEERAERHRDVGGHGREDVLERRERHQHEVGRERAAATRARRGGGQARGDGLVHEVDERAEGAAHRARHPDLAGAAGRVAGRLRLALQGVAHLGRFARPWRSASAPARGSRGRRRSRSTRRRAAPPPRSRGRAPPPGGRAGRPYFTSVQVGWRIAVPGCCGTGPRAGQHLARPEGAGSRACAARGPSSARIAGPRARERARAGRGVGHHRVAGRRSTRARAPRPSAARPVRGFGEALAREGHAAAEAGDALRAGAPRRPAHAQDLVHRARPWRAVLARLGPEDAGEAAREVDDAARLAVAGAPSRGEAGRGRAAAASSGPRRGTRPGATAWAQARDRARRAARRAAADRARRAARPQAAPAPAPRRGAKWSAAATTARRRGPGRVPRRLQLLHERAGVDLHRARGLAHRVAGAGRDALVGEVGLERVRAVAVLGLPSAPSRVELARDHDALARGEREVARRAARLAEAALDAAVGERRDRAAGLQVLEVGARGRRSARRPGSGCRRGRAAA